MSKRTGTGLGLITALALTLCLGRPAASASARGLWPEGRSWQEEADGGVGSPSLTARGHERGRCTMGCGR